MKKNSKYLSSAVALALLATAPVVVPVIAPVIGTINVKAADSQTQQRWDANDISSMDSDPNVPGSSEFMIYRFLEQFDDRYVASTNSLTTVLRAIAKNTDHGFGGSTGQGYPYFNAKNPQHIYDMQNDAGVSALKDSDVVEKNGTGRQYFEDIIDNSPKKYTQYYNNDVFAYMSVAYMSDGKWTQAQLNTRADIEKFCYQLDGQNPTSVDVSGLSKVSFPLRVTMHVLPGYDSNGNKMTAPDLDNIDPNTLQKTFIVNPSTMNITKNKNIISVPKGTKLSEISNRDKLTITDNYSNDTNSVKDYINKMETPHYGGVFTTLNAAKSYSQSQNFNATAIDSGDANNYINMGSDKTDGTLEKPGLYYQVVSYKLSDGYTNTNEKIKDVNNKDTDSYKLNGDQAIGYMFSKNGKDPLTDTRIKLYDTMINGEPATENKDYIFNTSSETLTVIRKIAVTGDDTPTNPIKSAEVNVGTNDKDKSLDISKDVLKNDDDQIADAPASGDYYKTDPASDSNAQVVSNALDTPGTYYRALKYTLTNNLSAYDYDFGKDATVNYDDNTVTYYQKVTVKPKSTSGSGSRSSHNWTITSPTGTVTTKNDQDNYPVVNDDDKTIDGITIPKDTPLKIDRARTDQVGNKQYHIADNEWINANYVTLNGQSNLSVMDQEKGVLYVDKTASYYKLYNNDGKEITNRALGENTYWAVDEIATDNQGNTYYRVATNEWVKQVNGVHYPIPLNLINIQNNNGVLYLDGTRQNYTLYDQNGRVITNRALGADSYWAVDKVANDNEGNTYYRVATNEWIEQRNGVHYPVK